jgi:membrane protease YdiL (CAAX protease family)
MNYYLFNILSMLIAISIPLLVERIKGKPPNDDFNLRDLSTVLSILIAYYAILYLYFEFQTNEHVIFYFFIIVHIALTTALIAAVVRFTPLKASFRSLLTFPRFGRRSGSYIIILCFFLYTSFTVFKSVSALQGRLDELGPANLILLKAVYNSPFIALPIFILTEIFGVAGEEIVCRYFAINALRQKLGRTAVIVISSLIWTLMHWDTNPNIFILGLLLGYLYYETGSLSLCILLHFIYNLTILTMPFYLFFRQTGDIAFPPFQYVFALFVLQVILYQSVELLFAKTGKIPGNDT